MFYLHCFPSFFTGLQVDSFLHRNELWLIRLMYLNTIINPWLYAILRRESVRRFFVLVLRCRQRCCVNAEEEHRNTEVTNFANQELKSDWRIHSEKSSLLNQVPCIRWSGSINICPFSKTIKAVFIDISFAVPILICWCHYIR